MASTRDAGRQPANAVHSAPMTWKISGSLLVGVAAGIAVLHGCSSDDDSNGPGSTGGSAGMGGDGTGNTAGTSNETGGTGGTANTGGANLGGGGLGGNGGSGPAPEMICEENALGQGGAVEPRCAVFPTACGDVDDYDGATFLTEEADESWEQSPRQVVFTLAGNDSFTAYGSGSCIVGGPGDDFLGFSNEPSEPRSNIGIGGPGTDTWRLYPTAPDAPAILADVEADETIQVGFGAGEGVAGDAFIEIIENFGGTDAEIQNPATRGVYDPATGKIWQDSDGSGTTYQPDFVGTVANADEVTLTKSNFMNP